MPTAAPRISVGVITRNEGSNIADCLASAAFADERVVLDSGSADRTADLAREGGAAVHERPFDDFASQKNALLDLCSGDWVFVLDADERIPGALADEIRTAAAAPPDAVGAFRVRRRNTVFGHPFRYGGLQTDAPVRLLRRGRCRFVQPVHEEVEVEGETRDLASELVHHTTPTIASWLDRCNRYTTLEARLRTERGERPDLFHFVVRPLARFLRAYVWRGGFRDGLPALVYHGLGIHYDFLIAAKMLERRLGTARDGTADAEGGGTAPAAS